MVQKQDRDFLNKKMTLGNIPISSIRKRINNPRLEKITVNEDGLRQLSASFGNIGQIVPILVRRIGNEFELLNGERRIESAKNKGQNNILALIIDEEINNDDFFIIAFVANIGAKNYHPLAIALGIKRIRSQGKTEEEVAAICGQPLAWVKRFEKYLDIHPKIQTAVLDGKISPTTGLYFSAYAHDTQPDLFVKFSKLTAGLNKTMSQSEQKRLLVSIAQKHGAKKAKVKKRGTKEMSAEHLATRELNRLLKKVEELSAEFLSYPQSKLEKVRFNDLELLQEQIDISYKSIGELKKFLPKIV